ncbi:MAG: helix-turn-helix domain-containing protein [Chloroflexota bacterium]
MLSQYQHVIGEIGGLASDRLHGPAARVCHTLWRDTRGAFDQSVTYTHEALAARASTDRSRATRTLAGLQGEGTIRVDRREHRIVVIDRGRLADRD